MVSTLDSESNNPSSNLGRTFFIAIPLGNIKYSILCKIKSMSEKIEAFYIR